MKRIIKLIIFIMTFSCISIYAIDNYFSLSLGSSYITNKLSAPLPLDGDKDWLEHKQKHPFIQRYDIKTSLTYNMFFSNSGITGLSFSFDYSHPLYAKTTIPIGDLNKDWIYETQVASNGQLPGFLFGVGPSFRLSSNNLEYGFDLRFTVSSYDLFNSTILGLQVNPYLNIPITDSLFFSLLNDYNFYLIKLIQDPIKIYETDFTMLSIGLSIGIKYKF